MSLPTEYEYYVNKGEILKRFQEKFYERQRDNPLYRNILEVLIRNGDPFEMIEKLIEINDEAYTQIRKLVELIPPQINHIT